jgi:hypothetical protein
MPVILRPRDIAGLWRPDPTLPPLPNEFRSFSELLKLQRAYLARNVAASPPREIHEPKHAYIGNGAWRIHCVCGEATHADPDVNAAACFGCGAIYLNVVFPDDAREIETLLVKRPVQGHRNWQQPETLADLKYEQFAHGDPL